MEKLTVPPIPTPKMVVRPTAAATPRVRRLQERRLLLMWEAPCSSEGWQHKGRYVPMWIDDHGSCFEEFPGPAFHHLINDDGSIDWRGDARYGSPFHSYLGEHGVRISIRCPSTLTQEEKLRIVTDAPVGVWRDVANSLLESKVEKPSSRRKSKADEAIS